LAKSQFSFKTATELSAALAAKQVSAVELAQDTIGRIERHDPKSMRFAHAISSAACRPHARPTRRGRAARPRRCSGFL
jgi:amidase